MGAETQIGIEEVLAARAAVEATALRTPTLEDPGLSRRCGSKVVLKAESLQRGGSFKLRGVSAKLATLGDQAKRGVVAGTAGNHGRALALGAQAAGVPCQLFVPDDAPASKIGPALALGARVERMEGTVDDCVEAALAHAEESEMAFVHPFDDLSVIAGQGSIGLELLEEVDDLRRVLVPLGGGGLASGIAIAVKAKLPGAEVIGVQVEGCAPFPQSLADHRPVQVKALKTVADGIAVKRPGKITLPLVERLVDRVVTVSEDQTADAMATLLEASKLVVEGAGAVGVAALSSKQLDALDSGTTAVVLSGGNVDEALLAAVARRAEFRQGRAAVLYTRISDRPGGLARLLDAVAETGANVMDVRHLRQDSELHVAETGIELILETRGPEHTEEIVAQLAGGGYEVDRQHTSTEEVAR